MGGSTRRISTALHRFWGNFPPRVTITLQKRDEKRILVSRNYYAFPGSNVIKALWKQEIEKPTEERPNTQKQLFSRNFGQAVDNESPSSVSLSYISIEDVCNDVSLVKRSKHKNQDWPNKLGRKCTGPTKDVPTEGKPAAVGDHEHFSSRSQEPDIHERLTSIYGNVLVVVNVSTAKEVVRKLRNQYRHLIHACHAKVAKIDIAVETPVDHGVITCFSIYSGPDADFGNQKSCIWIDVLDGGGKDLLVKFAPFFEDPGIKKVWHNYSFDRHVIGNYGISVSGFHADTMLMARLWDASRNLDGGYSLEALTGDPRVRSGARSCYEELIGKVSMKTIFSKKKVKKDGSEGKMTTVAPVEVLQRKEREPWICFSALDTISSMVCYESLQSLLSDMLWKFDGKPVPQKSMFDFYQEFWQPFGEILVRMEAGGILVDRAYLAELEKAAKAEQEVAANRFVIGHPITALMPSI